MRPVVSLPGPFALRVALAVGTPFESKHGAQDAAIEAPRLGARTWGPLD
jgi:hypothetical protein